MYFDTCLVNLLFRDGRQMGQVFQGLIDRFLDTVRCLDHAFVADAQLEDLPAPAQVGKIRVSGIDLNKPRMRAVLAATLALALSPGGFRLGDLVRQVQLTEGIAADRYGTREAAY